MIKTCLNCSHFKGCLEAPNEFYHIHNYCDIWDKSFPDIQRSLLTSLFWEYEADLDELAKKDKSIIALVYDDVEIGLASCYLFNPNETYDDKEIVNRFNHNKKLLIRLLDYVLEKGSITYIHSGKQATLDDEDIALINEYRERIKNITLEYDRSETRYGEE